jgi:hypothetical protein
MPANPGELSGLDIAGPRGADLDHLIETFRRDLARTGAIALDRIPQIDPEARHQLATDLDRHRDIRRLRRAVEAALAAGQWHSLH